MTYPVRIQLYPFGIVRVAPKWRVLQYQGDVWYDGEYTAIIDGQEIRGSVYELDNEREVFVPEGFGDIYLLERDVDVDTLTLQTEEVMGVRWADECDIIEMISRGEFIPYVKDFVGLLFYLRNHATLHTAPDLTRE